MALKILKLLHDLLSIAVAGIQALEWTNIFIGCFNLIFNVTGYLGLSLGVILLTIGALLRSTQSIFLLYLSLSPKWRPILLKSTLGEVRLPYICRLILFFEVPLLNMRSRLSDTGYVRYLVAKWNSTFRFFYLKLGRDKVSQETSRSKATLRIFTCFWANIIQIQRTSEIALELGIFFNSSLYFKFKLTRLPQGFFEYDLQTPFWWSPRVKSTHAVVFFLALNFLLIGCSSSILIIFAIPFLDVSGIDAPVDRIRYFWDSTEFGRQMRTQFKERITNYEYMFQVRKRWIWDPHKQFMANLLRKRIDFKIQEIPTYEEKTKWGWFLDRAGKIGVFLICVGALFFFFEFCDTADMGMWTPPGPDEW